MKLEVVFFNMSSFSEWQKGVVNRNYHVFHKLLKNKSVKRVIAVDFLPFTFKRLLRNYWENILQGVKGDVVFKDLTTRCVKLPGFKNKQVYVFSTIDSFFSHKKVVDKLNIVLDKLHIQDMKFKNNNHCKRVIWSYFPMFIKYFEDIRHDLSVFDAVDNWIEHPSFIQHKHVLSKNYSAISRNSDLIFTVSENLILFFKNLGREHDIYWIANGIDANHFIRSENIQISDFPGKIPKPIIGYVGTIQDRVDINLLEYLADKNPNKSFVLVGPLWPVFLKKFRKPAIDIKKLKKHKNIYLLGRKSYKTTPGYIRNFDVCIIPHKLDQFIKYTYSLKVLEYLACGKPVVTTPPSGVDRFSHLIHIAENYDNFNKKIDLALKFDKINMQKKRMQRIKKEDWNYKIKQMVDLIINKL